MPVRRITLIGEKPVPLWDFRRSVEMIEHGYRLAYQAIADWPAQDKPSMWRRLGVKSVLEDLLKALDRRG